MSILLNHNLGSKAVDLNVNMVLCCFLGLSALGAPTQTWLCPELPGQGESPHMGDAKLSDHVSLPRFESMLTVTLWNSVSTQLVCWRNWYSQHEVLFLFSVSHCKLRDSHGCSICSSLWTLFLWIDTLSLVSSLILSVLSMWTRKIAETSDDHSGQSLSYLTSLASSLWSLLTNPTILSFSNIYNEFVVVLSEEIKYLQNV